jgi:hypothetical protein
VKDKKHAKPGGLQFRDPCDPVTSSSVDWTAEENPTNAENIWH